MRRRFATAVAIVTFVIALVVAAAEVNLQGVDETWIDLVGGLGLLLGVWLFDRARRRPIERVEPGVPELPVVAPAPGSDESQLYGRFLNRVQTHSPRRDLGGLRAAAIEVVSRVEHVDREEAQQRVERGTWTNDDRAAAFLSGSEREGVRDLVAGVLGIESSYQRGFRRVVDELLRLSDTAPGNVGDDAAPDSGGDAARRIAESSPPRETNHWAGIGVLALVGVAAGVLTKEPAVLLVAATGVGYATYSRPGAAPEPELAIERRLSDDEPAGGDEVGVEVTITNTGDSFLPDLRVVDVVPDELAVVDGTPRHGTSLRTGESRSFRYVVEARAGRHPFAETLVISRSVNGAVEQADVVTSATSLTCIPPLENPTVRVPLRTEATPYTGQHEIDAGGDGVEFYGVRDYRPGDAFRRIDWNRYARTGTLTTIEYRQERAARVMVVIDVRQTARVAPNADTRHAIDRSVEAARLVVTDLLDRRNFVGIAALGSEPCWLAPGTGSEHGNRARKILASHPAFSGVPEGDGQAGDLSWERQLRRHLRDGTQIVLCTPLVDTVLGLPWHLEALGHPVTVVSPDATTDGTPATRLAALHRALLIQDVRDVGIPVFDWQPDEPFELALARTREL